MKRILKIFICLIPILSVFSLRASAEEDYIGRFSELLDDERYADADFLRDSISLENIFSDVSDEVALALSDMTPRLFTLLGLSVLSALCALYKGRYKDGVVFGVSVVTTLTAYVGIIKVFFEITDSMSRISSFFSSLIPLLSAVTLSGGGGYTAAGQSLGMATTVSLFSGVITPLFIALLGVMLAFGMLSSFGVGGTAAFMRGAKRYTLLLLSLVSAVILGTVSLQTVLSSARDSAAMRAAKHLAQTALPVVGGTVSASLSTLWSGLSLTKGVIGVGGILVIVGMLSGPLISLLIYRFALGVFSVPESFLGASSQLSRVSECLELLIGVYSIISVIYIFEIVLFINGGVAAL